MDNSSENKEAAMPEKYYSHNRPFGSIKKKDLAKAYGYSESTLLREVNELRRCGILFTRKLYSHSFTSKEVDIIIDELGIPEWEKIKKH